MKCWCTKPQNAYFEISYIGNQNQTKWDMEGEENPGDCRNAVGDMASFFHPLSSACSYLLS